MPLPAASVQNELSSQPEMSEVPRIIPKLLQRKVVNEQGAKAVQCRHDNNLIQSQFEGHGHQSGHKTVRALVLRISRGRSCNFDSHSTSFFTPQ